MFFAGPHTFEEGFYRKRGVDERNDGADIACVSDPHYSHSLPDHYIHQPVWYHYYFDDLLTFKKRFNFFVC
jgi:hypothetical protein